MLLAIDNGNTNVKFALVNQAGAIVQRWRLATDIKRTADEYAVWLNQLLEMEGYTRWPLRRARARTSWTSASLRGDSQLTAREISVPAQLRKPRVFQRR